MEEQVNRSHRKPKEKKAQSSGSSNPKAYTFANPWRFKKQAARAHDVAEKRLHVPLVDRLPEEAPPLVVGVVGPPQVGKTTLIKSLIRRYTKQTLSNPIGPLTVVTAKRRRLTFLECPADSLAAMIDVAKIVDIVLLMIDGKYGFEMETMEFLNILSSTGMPGNVFGILTKLDLFKKQDTLRAQKKRLKHRFWSELYQGAKLFYFSGVVNGRYPDREVLNLSRFLSVMKNPRPLVWRNSHPYCLADRFLDITSPADIEDNQKCDRTIALYGYLRGTNFPANGANVHIPGIGDLNVATVESLPDPCPTPYMQQEMTKATGKSAKRRLGEKQKILFAPMSDVGGVLVDSDAVYIDIKSTTFDREAGNIQDKGLGEQLVIGLQGDRKMLGRDENGVRLFGSGITMANEIAASNDTELETRPRRPASGFNIDGLDNGTSISSSESGSDGERQGVDDIPDYSISEDEVANDDEFSDSEEFEESELNGVTSVDIEDLAYEDDDDSEVDSSLRWKANITRRAKFLHEPPTHRRIKDLARMLYDDSISPSEVIRKWNHLSDDIRSITKEDHEDELFTRRQQGHEQASEGLMISNFNYDDLEAKWKDPKNIEHLRQKFSTSHMMSKNNIEDAENNDTFRHTYEDADEDSEGDGDFEDLEIGEPNQGSVIANKQEDLEAERERNARRKEELKMRFEEEDRDGFLNDKTNSRDDDSTNRPGDFGEDEWYDAEKAKIQKQLDINRAEFEELDERSRAQVEGYRAGKYVRIVLKNVPYEFSQYFNPRHPLIIGGLSPTENRFGFLQVRIKRHRWHQKILKTNDPLIFSLGWRRFQTIPIYSLSDSRTRNRMLKYTPEHMHCFGTFYGPLVAPNTGFCCVQSLSNKNNGFRLAATGVVLNVDQSTEIVKKLKLKGYPHKIFRNTAIIRDMFASELEVAKFKAGNLRTVSGVRGMIKGRAGNQYPEGYVRAGFEDKILMSDIVFLSSWALVQPREFYMPVTNLLLPQSKDDENESVWNGMRLTGEIRRDEGLKIPQLKDSLYRPIERPARHFNPLRVPRKLAADLPFKSQIAQMKPRQSETYMQKRAVVLGGEEKRARDLMQKLTTLRNEKVAKRQEAQERRKEPHRKKVAEDLEKKEAREKREKDEYWRREGKKRRVTEQDSSGGGKRRRT